MVGPKIRWVKRKTDWVSNLLQSRFFGSCGDHRELRKNEKNMFCIDCNLCFCKHCVGSSTHCFHRWLQVCKYVYHDVVRLQDIQKYLDCSKIQTYKINGEKAVHLNPRPSRDQKPSKSKGGVACEACERHIQDCPNNRFCSIACKVSVRAEFPNGNTDDKLISFRLPEVGSLSLKENYAGEENRKENDSFSLSSFKDTSRSWSSTAESSEEIQAWMKSTLKPKKKQHKRKGVPRRAPLG